ncbi:MAG: PAS domain S-box protein [Candidatus Electrothrix sp. AR3]|nr:PAS domain S-box protein [Candidatus Electrothrix sp. AR3]
MTKAQLKNLHLLRQRVTELESTARERKQTEDKVKEHQTRLNKAEEMAHLGSWEMDIATGKSRWSAEFYRICGLQPGTIEPSAEEGFKLIHPDDRQRAAETVTHTLNTGKKYKIEKRIIRPDGSIRYVQSVGEVLYDYKGQATRLMGSFLDITERKEAEIEREQLIQQLQTALAKVRLLSGLLPICAWCKNIRDDRGYWHRVEVYLQDHSEANFSHGICPECTKKVMPANE